MKRCMDRLAKAQSSSAFAGFSERSLCSLLHVSDMSDSSISVGQPDMARPATAKTEMTVGAPVTPVLDLLTGMWQLLSLPGL